MLGLVVKLVDELSRCHTRKTWVQAADKLVAPRRVRIIDRSVALVGARDATLERVLTACFQHVIVAQRAGDVSRRAHTRLRELSAQTTTPDIIARSDAMRGLLAMLPRIAWHDVTVLLLGESGVGKELVARKLHERSQRARLPFVALNCGALPSGLVESLLFGHERGAFTGATRRAAGAFEKANHGTLFLDEIGELPRAAQAKLLRAVETGEITRVGGETSRVDVRIIAATNRDLEHGDFRRDLYFRLATCVVRIPPLRERKADIEPLARELVRTQSRAMGLVAPTLSRGALAKLRAYAWPGNVRELENVITRSLIAHERGALEVDLAPIERRTRQESWRVATKRIIESALRASGGRIHGPSGAAAMLELKPTTLQSKMRKLGVDRRGARA